MIDDDEIRRRAIGALRGLAVGDAMGAATEGYLPDEVEEVYEAPIAELVDPVNLYPDAVADRQLAVIGGVTRAALDAAEALSRGERPALAEDGIGWAVPLGIVSAIDDLDGITQIVAGVADVATAASGAAVAAAVAAGVSGYMVRDAISLAVRAAELAGSPDVVRRIVLATGEAQASGGRQVGAVVGASYPAGPGIVDATAFAFGVAFGAQSVRRAIPEAVNQGGRASLSAALAGAICGAIIPGSTVESWSDQVEAASGIDLAALAGRLLEARRRRVRSG
ncbi:MAG: ADP-ribosylglycohydrolase family protein [Dehalococcoidia bacterium]